MRDGTARARQLAIQALCTRYLESGICALLNNSIDTSDRHAGLMKIITRAANLSFSLWTQKIYLQPKTLDDDDVGDMFFHLNPLMQRHQFHSEQLEDNEAALDGKPILVIVHPALVQHGDEYGKDFGVRTVLKQAVCWMGHVPTV